MKVWIAGQNGLLGQACRKALKGELCVGTSRVDLDMTDRKAVRRFVDEHEPTHLINCSGFTGVDLAEYNKEAAHAINAQAVEEMGKLGIKVLHFSTDYVFGGTKRSPHSIHDTPAPLSVYGMTKLRGEQRLLDVNPKACVVRTAWLFGHGRPNFVSQMMELMQKNKVVRVIEDQIGSPCYADDIAEAAVGLLNAHGLHHVVNSGVASRLDWAKSVHEQMLKRGMECMCEQIEPAQSREFLSDARRPAYSALDGINLRHWKKALECFMEQEALCPVA
ncbi:MAG: dTDP-4-dehydrorhamnose reductase [Chlamydiales bacterium]|nr:dTDP-4-dehydrorhamnose reductase [Chlamydiales bacterium]